MAWVSGHYRTSVNGVVHEVRGHERSDGGGGDGCCGCLVLPLFVCMIGTLLYDIWRSWPWMCAVLPVVGWVALLVSRSIRSKQVRAKPPHTSDELTHIRSRLPKDGDTNAG